MRTKLMIVMLEKLAGRSLLVAVAFALVGTGTTQAGLFDMFGGWSEIGDPGNTSDAVLGGRPRGYGAVGYTYSIAKYAVSENDWFAIMGGTDPDSDQPMVNIDLYGARQFANKLTENANGSSTAYNLYTSDGTDYTSYDREDALWYDRTVYAIPTEDEWYKAAYYDASVGDGSADNYSFYADGLDTDPDAGATGDENWNYDDIIGSTRDVGVGGLEQNGTRNMMGNVFEWTQDLEPDGNGLFRGGAYYDAVGNLASEARHGQHPATLTFDGLGFRVVAIPEPSSALLIGIAGIALLRVVRRHLRG